MKAENTELCWTDKYPIKPAKDMCLQEFCNWIALCNALKFINQTSAITGKYVDETEIVYKELIHYISSVSGDVATCIKNAKGVPFKYSLFPDSEDARQVEDLSFEFLGS